MKIEFCFCLEDIEVLGRRAFAYGKEYRIVMATMGYVCVEGDTGYVNVFKPDFNRCFIDSTMYKTYSVSWMGAR